ncbi:unnamed protein product [Gordionus sp. m RMFG-2023]
MVHQSTQMEIATNEKPITHTLNPTTTGTCVIGLIYEDGIIFAADTLVSYGNMLRYFNFSRLIKINAKTCLAFTGDIADFQFIQKLVEERVIQESCYNDGFVLDALEWHTYITRILYHRRSKLSPLWNIILVGGITNSGEKFLGYIDMYGVGYKAPVIATGFGGMLVQPLIRETLATKEMLSEEEAKSLIKRSMRLLYLRNTRSANKYNIALITKDGVNIGEPETIEADWNIAKYVM